MTELASTEEIDTAVDNDVILKAACYRLTEWFWPPQCTSRIGVLGTARFVLPGRLSRKRLSMPAADALAELDGLLAAVTALEPTEGEIELAAVLEAAAQLTSVPLDAGESQLAAIVVSRGLRLLESGDKRAVRALELLRPNVDWIAALDGRIRCLEQLVLPLVVEDDRYADVAQRVCAEPTVDTALTMCFSCRSALRPPRESIVEGLQSYINDLRRGAPNILEP